jgi:ABC-type branched-subunit amino acid transport system ATPase component
MARQDHADAGHLRLIDLGRHRHGRVDLVATPSHRIVEVGIAHVPENRRLFPRMTVEDNLPIRRLHPGGSGEVPAAAG